MSEEATTKIDHNDLIESWTKAAEVIPEARNILYEKIKALKETRSKIADTAPKTSELYTQELTELEAQRAKLEYAKKNEDNSWPIAPTRQQYEHGSPDQIMQKLGDHIEDSKERVEFQDSLVRLGNRYAGLSFENYDLSEEDRKRILFRLGADAPQPKASAAEPKKSWIKRLTAPLQKPAQYEISTKKELVELNRKLHAAIAKKLAAAGITIGDDYPIDTEALEITLREVRKAQATLDTMQTLPQVAEEERANLKDFTEKHPPHQLERLLGEIQWFNQFSRKELLPDSPQERKILGAYNELCGRRRDYLMFDLFNKSSPPSIVSSATNLLIASGISLSHEGAESSINKARVANLISPDHAVRQAEIEAIAAEMDAKMLTPKEEPDYDRKNTSGKQNITQISTPWSARFSAAKTLADEITASQAAAKSK